MLLRRIVFAILLVLPACLVLSARAQVVPAATAKHVSVTVGGMASVFQPDFAGSWTNTIPFEPIAETSNYPLIGIGAYVDIRLTHWIQLEAEGRWLRFNQYAGIYQDNYLIGPRVPIHRFWKANFYGKVLGGFSSMHFDDAGDHGRFTDIAFGGGADIKLTRRISLRAFDVEYQYWPAWGNSTLSPYGASMGVSYRVF